MNYLRPTVSTIGYLVLSTIANAWSPGVYTSPMPSRGFTVDMSNRNDVISFWQAIYEASEDFENRPMWKESTIANYYTIDFTTPAPSYMKANGVVHGSGELSLGFVKDVERRVNFHRALIGVPASVALMDSDTAKNSSTVKLPDVATAYDPPATTLKADAAQRSAYAMARTYADNGSNYGTLHDLTAYVSTIAAFSPAVFNGNINSNLASGFYGPRAIDVYLTDDVDGTAGPNVKVGHRLGLLAHNSTNFATGDTPGAYIAATGRIRPSTNALYVIQKPSEIATVPARFIPYPSKGFFPAQLNSKYWSLSVSSTLARFTNATVVVTRDSDGSTVSTTILNALAVSPSPTMVWQINDTAASSKTVTQDTKYNVTVSGMTGISPTTYSYSVTLINPDLLTADQSLIGTTAPPALGSAAYIFTPPPQSEGTQINVFTNSAAAWTENAESNPATQTTIIDRTAASYDLFSSAISPLSGSKSFRLVHPVFYDAVAGGVPDQSFEINRNILASASNSSLSFKYRRNSLDVGSRLVVELTTNDGATWTAVGATIAGAGSNNNDNSPVNWAANLPQSAEPYHVRFRLYKTTGSIFTQENNPSTNSGIYIDDITTTNCTTLELQRTNELAAGENRFVFNGNTAGGLLGLVLNVEPYYLRVRSKLGGHWFPYAPAKIVTPVLLPIPGFTGWVAYEYPTLKEGFTGDDDDDGIANAIECAFYMDPLSADAPQADVININKTVTKDAAPGNDTLSISRSIPALRSGINYGAEWSETLAPNSWSSAGVTVSFANGLVTASAPAGNKARFIRWKISGL